MNFLKRNLKPLAQRTVSLSNRVGVAWVLVVSLLCCGFSLSYDCRCNCCHGFAQTFASDQGCECCDQGALANCCCCDQSSLRAGESPSQEQKSDQGCGCNSQVDVSFDLSGVDFAVVLSPKMFVRNQGRPVCDIAGLTNRSTTAVADNRSAAGPRKHLLFCVWLI